MGPYCLQYRLPKNISRQSVTGRLRVNAHLKKVGQVSVEFFHMYLF